MIGLAGRFPGASNIEEFWRNLRDGVESISFFTDEELQSAGINPALLHDPDYVKAAGVLKDAQWFDAAFFGFNPREADLMDPQHRQFMEVAWEALERAGYNPETYRGAIGVYAGTGLNTYLLFNLVPNRELVEAIGSYQTMVVNDKDFLPTRVSYQLNLRGPSVAVQTACSTSLVAVHQACQSILNGECDMALAGGVSVQAAPGGYRYQEGGILSPDGHCRAFDSKAQGTVTGSGVAIVVLKRLAEALADGDNILAVIKGTAINNDGSLKVGYTAPSVDGQAAVISEALAIAGIEPETTHYVEAHGTGTALGDPIEITALTQAYRARTQKAGYCAIGSVKTNVGHLDAAAGATGLIKTVLAMQHKLIPPSLHFEHANPQIDFANSPFYVNTELTEWKANGLPRRAGVSSFGIGGTNAHVILEEAPSPQASSGSRPWQLLTLSARTSSALETATTNLADHLTDHPDLDLADVAYTLQTGRKGFDHRRIMVCQTLEDAANGLRDRDPRRVLTGLRPSRDRSVAFMFSGQGTQYINMGRELYETEPTFRRQIDRCCEVLKPHLGLDLRALLYPAKECEDEAAQKIRETSAAQPALFVVEYALAQLWSEWGVRPRTMIGHSIGEYVAACLAGVFTLEDALAVVAARGRLMQALPGGAMLSVALPPQELSVWLNAELSLAAINAPSLCVVSGPTEAVEILQRQLTERGLACRRLHTSHAFHSKMLEPMLADFANEISRAQLNAPRIPYISNLTGTWIKSSQARDPQYWVRHARETVRFAEGVSRILEDEDTILLEVGPGRTLTTLARRQADQADAPVAVSSLRHPEDRQPDGAFLMEAVGRLWLAGAPVDWTRSYRNERRRRVLLPTYPFERQRFWVEAPKSSDRVKAHSGPLVKKPDPADWLYVPFWKPSVTPIRSAARIPAQENSCWLVFLDSYGLGVRVAERLLQEEQEVITISVGEQFARLDSRAYSLDPRQRSGYAALLNELRALDKTPERIVHLWSVTPKAEPEHWPEYGAGLIEEAQYLGLYSLLFLAQALAEQGMPDKIALDFISNHLMAAQGYEELRPEKATALGPCKVIPQEYPNIACRAIDVAIPDPGTPQWGRLIDQILDELTATASDTLVALRGNQRWVQSYEAGWPDGDFKPEPRLRERGVYWITGGLGNIGLSLAEYLAQAVQARLVLTGRSSFPEKREWPQWLAEHGDRDEVSRKIQKLRAMEEIGAEILVLSAELSVQDQVESAVATIDERFGRVDGVIHAAGILGAESLRAVANTGPIECAQQFQPKLHGLVVLEKALRGRDLDFCLLFSSLSSILGGLGFAAYSAANLFMDAFAHRQSRSSHVPWISVNWDGWKRGGAAESAQGLEAAAAELSLTPQEGIECFQRILSLAAGPQLVVSTGSLQTRINQWINLDSLRESGQVKSSEPSSRHARPYMATTYVAPENEIEATIAGIWQELLGIDSVGMHDDFFELGGHSLLATQLTSRLCQTFHLSLSVTKIFDTPTVSGLAESISRTHWAAQELSASSMVMEPGREQGEL
ncbi:MAG TPA: SDR family oxidoreductase [Blastocatellia bacterium]|nr:SDR family oxidoreductase [Blastocatellia bacterium]